VERIERKEAVVEEKVVIIMDPEVVVVEEVVEEEVEITMGPRAATREVVEEATTEATRKTMGSVGLVMVVELGRISTRTPQRLLVRPGLIRRDVRVRASVP